MLPWFALFSKHVAARKSSPQMNLAKAVMSQREVEFVENSDRSLLLLNGSTAQRLNGSTAR
jgi:hypothetical protein